MSFGGSVIESPDDLSWLTDSDMLQPDSDQMLSTPGSGTIDTDGEMNVCGRYLEDLLQPAPALHTAKCSVRRHHDVAQQKDIDTIFCSHLVDFWFLEVCEVCSVCDSSNLKLRDITVDSLARSQAATFAVQCMSAAYLQQSSVKARGCLSSLVSRGMTVLRKEMIEYLSTRCFLRTGIPSGPLFAAFVLGATMMLIDRGDVAVSLRTRVSEILDLCNTERESLEAPDSENLAYFQRCLMRWNAHTSSPLSNTGPGALLYMSECLNLGLSHDYADLGW